MKSSHKTGADLLRPLDTFHNRHLGADDMSVARMLEVLDLDSIDQLIDQTVPDAIRLDGTLDLPNPLTESEVLANLRSLAGQNKVYRTFIGQGYANTHTPNVILRNILENPGWYTQYTPYQAEIAQGRLEALINFQTMITDLTGLDIANASLLDEGTAAAEAMSMCKAAQKRSSTANRFFVSEKCHPQTIDIIKTRALPLGFDVVIGDHQTYDFDAGKEQETFGALLQYPATDGDIFDYSAFCDKAHEGGAVVVVAADLLALTLLTAPGEFGADIVVGNTQRFGVPFGFGGPHAAYMSTKEAHKRNMPGRLIGVSKDATGAPAYRLALQTREQHIRRDKATSNICTAQVLLAVMASMYAVYHGPDGLKQIAQRTKLMTEILATALKNTGYTINDTPIFDTLKISGGSKTQQQIIDAALANEINLRIYEDGAIGITLDETVSPAELQLLCELFDAAPESLSVLADGLDNEYAAPLARQSDYLTHPVFHMYRSETEMLRYITRLQSRDLSLTHSMIPLGSCTMKLNATVEMIPVTWPEFGNIHPFAPSDQTAGYQELFRRLEAWLSEITGFAATSLQPNAGSQGEYAGLLCIRDYHMDRDDAHRNICLIPSSAHGTNPASAVMAGMKVVVTACDDEGNIDLDDLRAKADEHADNLAALMVTYPSTHGVFEASIVEICEIIHECGGQVYMDGANMNAQVGLCRPGDFGPDVCHLNLHKTFCIPHGGGGPGVGPICVAAHLAPYLPGHSVIENGVARTDGRLSSRRQDMGGAVSAAPWGSAGILPISYTYIATMGAAGLTQATKLAILNANYMAKRLDDHFPVLYKGANGRVAHECILDLRPLKEVVSVDDVAKRLIDYGFHAPTMSFPVAGTLMIEPTESESLAELDRFCEAMIGIRGEIAAVERGEADAENNVLHYAPHTAATIASDEWDRPYSRQQAAYPMPWLRESKFWPYVARIDNVYGDRNLFCSCVPIEEFAEEYA